MQIYGIFYTLIQMKFTMGATFFKKRKHKLLFETPHKFLSGVSNSWFIVVCKTLGLIITIFIIWLCLLVAREMVWWPMPFKQIGLGAIILVGLMTMLAFWLFARLLLVMGWLRVTIVILFFFVSMTLLYAQYYLNEQPLPERIFTSVDDIFYIIRFYTRAWLIDMQTIRDEMILGYTGKAP